MKDIIEQMLKMNDIYFRLRLKERKIYKNGGKILELNSKKMLPSVSRISLNSKAVKYENFEEIKTNLVNTVGELIDFGYELSLEKVVFSHSSIRTEDGIKKFEEVVEKLKTKYNNFSIENEDTLKPKIVFDKPLNLNQYKDLLETWKDIILMTINNDGICHMVKVKIKLKEPKNLTKIINKTENYINVCLKILENYEKYIETKNDGIPNNEKSFQQEIMNVLNDNHSKISRKNILNAKNSPFKSDFIPFELEWVEKEDNARIDAVFLATNKIILCEVKYNEGVIGKENGLHKHLDDLYMIIKNKDKKEKMIKNIINKAIERKNILNEYGISYDVNLDEEKTTVEYLIICGYSGNKEIVLKELDRVCNHKHKFSDELNYWNKKVPIKTDLTVNEYILNMKECSTNIYIVDSEFKEFAKY